MSWTEAWKVCVAVLASLGSGGAIVFSLSGYLGKRWADRALEEQRQKYASMNLQLQNQMELAARRLQVELDTISHVKKLHAEQEFEKTLGLWKKCVSLRDALMSMPRQGGQFGLKDLELRGKHIIKASGDFLAAVSAAHEFLSQEILSIPKLISDQAQQLLTIADVESLNTLTHLGPTGIQTQGSDDHQRFFEERSKNQRDFMSAFGELEKLMQDHVDFQRKTGPHASGETR